MRATSFFKDDSIEFKYIEQLKNEIIHNERLYKHNLNAVKFILIDGSFMPDKLLFANMLRNELTKVYQDNKQNCDLVKYFGLTSKYKNGAYLVNSYDVSSVNIYIDDNENIGRDWFDFVFTVDVPNKECRQKIISDVLDGHEDLLDCDSTGNLIEKIANVTSGLYFIPIKQIINNVLSYAVVSNVKVDYKMFSDYINEFKRNHGIEHYWS